MSLVGTRPPTLDEWEKYEPHHRARMSFRPGLTGLWQVSGRSNITDFEEAEWNDPVLGQPTTFHVSATGGSGKYQFRMDAPSYSSPNQWAFESVADPSRGEWMNYTSECASNDYTFTMTATGTYNFRFYVMDKPAGVYYLRLNFNIGVSDSKYPSVLH